MPMVSRLESHRNCEQGRIMEGVYEEYIVIEKKSYLMMSGAGINLTIITGNHSSVDGWGTSHLATFS
ncbi:unnamed protein product [Brassica oleracea var. botrytis]